MKTLLIGMRDHRPERPVIQRWYDEFARGQRSGQNLLEVMMCVGTQLERLHDELDLSWDSSANLLPPASNLVPWDRVLARMVGRAWMPIIREQYTHLLLAGNATYQAMGYAGMKIGDIRRDEDDLCVIALPHPGVSSRWWGDPDKVTRLKERLREALRETG